MDYCSFVTLRLFVLIPLYSCKSQPGSFNPGYRQVKNLAERDCLIKCRRTAPPVEAFHSGDTNINTYAESYEQLTARYKIYPHFSVTPPSAPSLLTRILPLCAFCYYQVRGYLAIDSEDIPPKPSQAKKNQTAPGFSSKRSIVVTSLASLSRE